MTEGPERDQHGRFKPTGRSTGGAWTPHTEIGTHDAEAVIEGGLSESDALTSMGLDPALWEVVSYRIGRWPGTDGDVKESTRLSAKRRVRSLRETVSADELIKSVDRWGTPDKAPAFRNARTSFVVNWADWQCGKGEGGGTSETIDRVLNANARAAHRVRELRSIGRDFDELVIQGLGDLHEGVCGWYQDQAFTVDLDHRGQERVVRHLITAGIRLFAPLFRRIVVVPVGGNHDTTRINGKEMTTADDNKAVSVFEVVQEILAERPGYEHVEFKIPDNAVFNSYEASGTKLGLHHGHLMSGGANSAAKAERFWKNHAFGKTEIADAEVFTTGHYHSLAYAEWSDEGRCWIQCPALDGGSRWFKDMSGVSSAPGMLTYVVGDGAGPRKIDDIWVA